jgi:hypothetical protein
MYFEPQAEHQWLERLVGDWTYEAESDMGPEQGVQKSSGKESVRSHGGMWVTCEGSGEMPCGGGTATTVMTLGYDAQKKQYIGTWIGSMMPKLWLYEGSLDAEGSKLTLESEGPDFEVEGKTAIYRDVIEFKSDDHRTLSGYTQGKDGNWVNFMTTHYYRQK